MRRDLHLLLVEDDQVDVEHVSRLLRQQNFTFTIDVADRLSVAIQLAELNDYDLALLDLSLPDSGGLETVSAFHRKTQNLPIVVLTAVSDPDLEASIVDTGAHDFLPKRNLDRDSLARCIRYLLDRQAASETLRNRDLEIAHLSRLQAISEMASAIVHELTEPLSVITNLSTASLLRIEAGEVALAEENVRAISRESSRAVQTVRRIRNFIRKGTLPKSVVHVASVVREATELVTREASSANVALTVESSDCEAQIHGDSVHVQQVILNLVRNAIDATANFASPAQVKIQIADVENSVVVRVIDNGKGDRDILDSLFTPFFTTRPNGVGLGLSISRTIIEAHGGEISASANAGQGLTFEFSLPKAIVDQNATA